MTIWNILWPFGIIYGCLVYVVCGHLLYFSRFGMFGPRRIWQPWRGNNVFKESFFRGRQQKDLNEIFCAALQKCLSLWRALNSFTILQLLSDSTLSDNIHTYICIYIHTLIKVCMFVCKSTYICNTYVHS
jgi:hypothetical protein